jgi:hypothetical protein
MEIPANTVVLRGIAAPLHGRFGGAEQVFAATEDAKFIRSFLYDDELAFAEGRPMVTVALEEGHLRYARKALGLLEFVGLSLAIYDLYKALSHEPPKIGRPAIGAAGLWVLPEDVQPPDGAPSPLVAESSS